MKLIMQKIQLFLNKLKYKIYRINYNLFKNYNFFIKLLISINFLIKLFEILVYEIHWDISILLLNYNKFLLKVRNLGFINFLLLLFFFILGIIPIIFFIYILFYVIKYIFKYIFLILDYIYCDDYILYTKIKYNIFYFFDKVPIILNKFYKFLFKSNWTFYFFNIILNYIKKIKNKLLSYFFKKIDYFLLIYLPKLFYKYKDKVTDDYRIFIIISYYKIKKKILIIWPWRIKLYFIKIYKKIYLRIYKKFYIYPNFKYQLIKLKYEKIYIKIYYYIRYKYTYIKYNLIWFLKVFIKSEACTMTIHAFFKLNYFRFRAYIIYISMHVYYSVGYLIIYNLYNLRTKIFKKKIYIYKGIYILKCRYTEKIKYIYSFRFCTYLAIVYHLFIWWVIVLLKTHFWIDFKDECYFLEYGDRSQSWWNLQLYAIVVKFFSKAYITNLFLHILDWKNIIYVARYYFWWFGNFKIFIYDILQYTWDHIILRKPFKKVEFKFNRFE